MRKKLLQGKPLSDLLIAVFFMSVSLPIGSLANESPIDEEIHRGMVAYKKADYRGAEQHFTFALQQAERLGPDSPYLTRCLERLSHFYFELGSRYYEKAIPLLQRYLEQVEKTIGKEDPSLAPILNDLAHCCSKEGRFAEAEQSFKRSLSITEKSIDVNSPLLAETRLSLAAQYEMLGKYAEAENLYKLVLSAAETAKTPAYSDVERAMVHLAGFYRETRRVKESKATYFKLLHMNEKQYGISDWRVVSVLNQLGDLMETVGDCKEAEKLYKRVLDISKSSTKPITRISSLENYARVLRKLRRGAEARTYEIQARTLRKVNK